MFKIRGKPQLSLFSRVQTDMTSSVCFVRCVIDCLPVWSVTFLSPSACRDRFQPPVTMHRISVKREWLDICGWIRAKTSSPFICRRKKALHTGRQTPDKTSLHTRSLSSYPLVVLGHNRRRDENEKTKTKPTHIS